MNGGQDSEKDDADASGCLSKFTPCSALEYHALTKPKEYVDNPPNADISRKQEQRVEFSIKSGNPEKQRSGCAIVGIFDRRKLSLAAELLDNAS
ncbi:MAG: hypothetical protein RBS35_03940, partial [Azonexus sp.]|nr:hypothetical protein [Azonexus sp.]